MKKIIGTLMGVGVIIIVILYIHGMEDDNCAKKILKQFKEADKYVAKFPNGTVAEVGIVDDYERAEIAEALEKCNKNS